MAQCKNRIGERCKLTGEVCSHLVYDGNCSIADVDSIPSVTFKDGMDAVLTLSTSDSRNSNIRRYFAIVVNELCAKWDDPIESLTYECVENMTKKLDSRYRPATVSSVISGIYAAGSDKLRTYYKERNLKVPVFDKFQYKKGSGNRFVLKWEQINDIKYEMETLRRNATNADLSQRERNRARDMFIAMWFGWWFGSRPGDINTMKWSSIVYFGGSPHIKYTPHKTIDTTGVEVVWPIPSSAFNQISAFIGKADDYCLHTNEKYIPIHTTRKRHNVHTRLWKSINKFFRGIGVTGWAGFYSLRYLNAQNTYKQFGEGAESLKLGHSVSTGKRAYYNVNDHSLVA